MPKPETLKTRPDLADDQEWLVWLRLQPENKGIEVDSLYRRMVEWCRQKGITPTRRRLINWLNNERSDVPMTYEPAYLKDSSTPASCTQCKSTGRVQVNDFNAPCSKCHPKESAAFWRARGR